MCHYCILGPETDCWDVPDSHTAHALGYVLIGSLSNCTISSHVSTLVASGTQSSADTGCAGGKGSACCASSLRVKDDIWSVGELVAELLPGPRSSTITACSSSSKPSVVEAGPQPGTGSARQGSGPGTQCVWEETFERFLGGVDDAQLPGAWRQPDVLAARNFIRCCCSAVGGASETCTAGDLLCHTWLGQHGQYSAVLAELEGEDVDYEVTVQEDSEDEDTDVESIAADEVQALCDDAAGGDGWVAGGSSRRQGAAGNHQAYLQDKDVTSSGEEQAAGSTVSAAGQAYGSAYGTSPTAAAAAGWPVRFGLRHISPVKWLSAAVHRSPTRTAGS